MVDGQEFVIIFIVDHKLCSIGWDKVGEFADQPIATGRPRPNLPFAAARPIGRCQLTIGIEGQPWYLEDQAAFPVSKAITAV